jgi:hypothetical protein
VLAVRSGRNSLARSGVAQLHHPLRAGQIAQRVGAQIGQPSPGREPIDYQRLGRADSTVCPPWARSRSRAVRLMVGPA